MSQRDLYGILGVDPGADRATIRVAYRTLARRHHPDMPGGSASQMVVLNAAWSVLRDPFTRKAYDRQRARLAPPASRSVHRAPAAPGPDDTVLDFGRYEGWSVEALKRHDPDYLDWLVRTQIGRRYRAVIEASHGSSVAAPPAAAPVHRGRRGRFARAR
jgi:curved DNA-binding protein CbpA